MAPPNLALTTAAQPLQIRLKRTEPVEEQEVVSQRLDVIETVCAHQGDHPGLHMIEIVLDRDSVHEKPLEIDRLQDREFAAFRVDAEIGDLRKAGLRHDVAERAVLD